MSAAYSMERVMVLMPADSGPYRPRPFATIRPTAEATGPQGDDRNQRENVRQAGRLRMIERELTDVQRRLDRILSAIREDDIAPMPQVFEDNGNGGKG